MVRQRTRHPAHLLMNVCSKLRRVRRPFRRVGRTVASWSWSSYVHARSLSRGMRGKSTLVDTATPGSDAWERPLPSSSSTQQPPPQFHTNRDEDRGSSFVSLTHRRPPSSPSRECVLFCSTAALAGPPPHASVRRGSSVERTRLKIPRIARGRRALVVGR